MKYKSSIVILVVCFSLLTACGGNNSKAGNSVNNWNLSEAEHTLGDDQIVYSNTEEMLIETELQEEKTGVASKEDEQLINEAGMT